jgi:uncharacterized protein (DUF2126 family)
MKIDIEGSEFELFNETDWLAAVEAISMELHHVYGDVQDVLAALSKHGFEVQQRLLHAVFQHASIRGIALFHAAMGLPTLIIR